MVKINVCYHSIPHGKSDTEQWHHHQQLEGEANRGKTSRGGSRGHIAGEKDYLLDVFAEHKNELPRNLCVHKNKMIWIDVSTKGILHQEEAGERGSLVITADFTST